MNAIPIWHLVIMLGGGAQPAEPTQIFFTPEQCDAARINIIPLYKKHTTIKCSKYIYILSHQEHEPVSEYCRRNLCARGDE